MKRFLQGMSHYLLFFLMVSFLVSCSIMLFTNELISALGAELTPDNLNVAARITFVNVVALSLLFTAFDELRRKLTVGRTAKRIAEAAKRIVAGDFTVRVPMPSRLTSDEHFFDIIDCFNQMAQELAGVETLRTDFISNVSHEMKTPLAAMQNYGTLLQDPLLSDEKRLLYAKGVTDGARRLADMMTNILKLNKLENQQIYPNTERFNLGEQLCESLLQFESIWEQENIEIETDIAEEVFIHADKELLSLVWNNLLSNAFKFTPSGGMVTLSLSEEDHFAVVKVQDTGCGMSSETGAHIFEKFYQGDTSHATRGNGLGLALVKRIVDILNGEISVESALGQGSTFTVKIRRS